MLPNQVFVTADDVHVEQAQRHGMVIPSTHAAEIPARMWWTRQDVPFFLPDSVAAHAPLPAYINHGRWVVMCECGGAQLASKDDPRFFCVSCLNEKYGGKWRPVTWPRAKDRAAIEGVLRQRFTENANWLPGETVADLQDENTKNGVMTDGLV